MGIIQQLMVDKEKDVIIELANTQCLNEDNYLLKDYISYLQNYCFFNTAN